MWSCLIATVKLICGLSVLPLLIAGTFAASVPKLLSLRSIGRWVPPASGVVLLTTGLITLIARWI